MNTKAKVVIAFIAGVIVTIAVPFIVLATGIIDWSAAAKPGGFEKTLSQWAFARSLQSRAPQVTNALSGSKAIAAGLNHYRENCLFCHGAPGVEKSEAGRGLNPPAPELQHPGTQQMTDGQLFWIAKNGIRMTGMPSFGLTHNDQELWQIIAFVRKLPSLTENQRNQLKSGAGSEEEHHHEESSENEKGAE